MPPGDALTLETNRSLPLPSDENSKTLVPTTKSQRSSSPRKLARPSVGVARHCVTPVDAMMPSCVTPFATPGRAPRATTPGRLSPSRIRAVPRPRVGSSASDAPESLSLDERKQLLIRLCANTDRGKNASPETAALIETQVRALEAANATRDPATSAKISGKWALIYTGASAADAASRAAKEGVIGSALTEVTGSSGNASPIKADASTGNARLARILQSGASGAAAPGETNAPLGRRIGTVDAKGVVENLGNFQDIDLANGLVRNRAELKFLGQPVEITIEASCAPVPAPEFGDEDVRLAVAFREVRVEIGSLPPLVAPLGWINDGKGPEGWLDTTYLDDDMRLGRGDKGSTFVTVRRGER